MKHETPPLVSAFADLLSFGLQFPNSPAVPQRRKAERKAKSFVKQTANADEAKNAAGDLQSGQDLIPCGSQVIDDPVDVNSVGMRDVGHGRVNGRVDARKSDITPEEIVVERESQKPDRVYLVA
jgi:hypothetical protein